MARAGSVDKNTIKNGEIKNKPKKSPEKNKKKINSKNKKYIFLLIASIFVLIVIFMIINNKKDLSEIDDWSKLDSKKYSVELLEEYSKEEGKDKFLEDYDLMQNAVGMYIMNSSTDLEKSFTSIVEELKEELKQENWEKLECERPKFWNGKFSIDDSGILKFKFSNKSIEPSWIYDEELNEKIIFN